MTHSQVAALVVNFNGGRRFAQTIDALVRQSPAFAEIIAVDNASTDGSPDKVLDRHPAVRMIRLRENIGLARARNLALASTEAPLVMVLDHDIYLEEDCLARMLACLHATGATVVCPRIRLVPEQHVVQADGAEIHFLCALRLRHAFMPRADLPVRRTEVGGAIGACQLMRREAVVDAGGFDEVMFFYQEDLEFSLRLRARGLTIWCEPSAEVLHERAGGTPGLSFRGTGSYPPRRAYLTMRHRLFAMLVHYRLRTLLVLAPALFLAELAALAAAIGKGWPLQWLRAWGWILHSLPLLLARRRVARVARRVPDRALLVGGEPPLAQAYLTSGPERHLFTAFTAMMRGYWRVVRTLIG